jgi:hypothetical protein
MCRHSHIYKCCQSLRRGNSVLEVAVFENVGKKLLPRAHDWFGVWVHNRHRTAVVMC